MAAEFQEQLRVCGWWALNRQKIAASPADYWIFVIARSARRRADSDFVIITPAELLRRLDAIHHGKPKIFQSYLWVTEKEECWETRDLTRPDQVLIAKGEFENNEERDFKDYLNNWDPIEELNRS
jgi:hypothetical protein